MERENAMGGTVMPPLSLLIKPVSGSCNLRCAYCFYRDEAQRREVENYGRIGAADLELLVRKALAFAQGDCTFAFQGGEPTLAGLGFYQELAALQRRYNVNNCRIHNAIQTNGQVIDGAWAEHFAREQFLVGLSIDGTKELHDSLRPAPDGHSAYTRAIRAAELLKRAGAEFNVLCVVNGFVARRAEQVYRAFAKQGFDYLQFIPCLDPLGAPPAPHSLSPERYAHFLKTTFDLWYRDLMAGRRVSVRAFDNWVGMLMGLPPEACDMGDCCSCQFVVEADLSVYPCDFYVEEGWRIGNLREDDFPGMRYGERAERFIAQSRERAPECAGCPWLPLCRGGCRRYRERDGEGLGPYRYCAALREFFPYALPRMRELAQRFSRG